MVGVPRSTGCAICVQRHLKCDETRPFCLRCQKGGRSCPGYRQRFVFKHSSFSTAIYKNQQDPDPNLKNSRQVVVRARHGAYNTVESSPFSRKLGIPALSAPLAHQSQLMAHFMSAFTPLQSELPNTYLYVRQWLMQVHDLIGKDSTLDLAMRSLASLFCGLKNDDQRLINAGHSIYVGALYNLRTDISSPRASKTMLQCSTMLLAFYELMSNRAEQAWIKHSGGASQIMRIRGADAYKSGLGYIMYMVCRAYILIDSFISSEPCFLEEPEWEALTRLTDSPQVALRERLFACIARLPRILRDARDAGKGLRDVSEVMSRASDLRMTMKNCFNEWWALVCSSNARPVEKPSGDATVPIAYWFPNIELPSFLCSYYSSLIILNRLLVNFGYSGGEMLVQESQMAAAGICKCVFQGQSRALGTIYTPFWLNIAGDGCAPEHRAWITSKWEQLRKPGNGIRALRQYQNQPMTVVSTATAN